MAKKKNTAFEPMVAEIKPIITTRQSSDFLNIDYLEYAAYVIQDRAIPSILDGFKTGARKILHTALHGSIKNAPKGIKMPVLIGETLPIYHHGTAPLEGTIITLSQYFNDNLNPLEIVGQGGSMRNPDAFGAARYLNIKLSKYAKLIYGVDMDLLTPVISEGMEMEPQYFLPIIPTVLTANTSGIAVGYSFSTISYDPVDIINACINVLDTGDTGTVILKPYIRGIKKSAWKFVNDRWESRGAIELEKNKVHVFDLPHAITFDDYEKHLNILLDKDEITEWMNISAGNKIHYIIHYRKEELNKRIKNDQLFTHLKLINRVNKNVLTVLDQNQKIMSFESEYDLVKKFVSMRLEKYNERKTRIVQKIKERIQNNNYLIDFIKAVIDGVLILANRTMAEVREDITKLGLSDVGLDIKLGKLTKDEYERLKEANISLKNEHDYILNTTIKEMYLKELNDLKIALIPDFQ